MIATGMTSPGYPTNPVRTLIPHLGWPRSYEFWRDRQFSPADPRGKASRACGDERNPDRDLPDVPTMTESGLPHLTRGFWSGLLAPAGTPAEIVNRLNAEINASLATPEMTASLMKLGFEPKIARHRILPPCLPMKSRRGPRRRRRPGSNPNRR